MEKRNLEQRCAIKFCVKLNENAKETYEKLRGAYGEQALSRTQVFRWHKAFLDGRESVEDEPRCGRPCTSKTEENVTKVRDHVRSGRRLTVRMINSVLNLNRQTVHEILTFELGMQKICAKLVPKILTNEQKENRRNVCLDLLERIENDKTRLIWVRVTSSFSQNSNSTSKVIILELWTTSKRSWQTSWGHFYIKTSSTATRRGKNVSGGVRLPKGTTLKGIMLIYR